MWSEVSLKRTVIVEPEEMQPGGKHKRSVIEKLLRDLEDEKCSAAHGYYISPLKITYMSQGRILHPSALIAFTVAFTCLVFKLSNNEVLEMEVREVRTVGVLATVGPYDDVFIHHSYMKDYTFAKKSDSADSCFTGVDGSVIREGTVLRARILGVHLTETPERSFRAVATINGDYLGEIDPPEFT